MWLALLLLLVGCSGVQLAASPAATHGSVASTPVAVPAEFHGGTVSVSALPREAKATLALIAAGGPFPYDQDGSVFGNREGLLPPHASGYYHEYTVDTPGSADRGARRFVVGAPGERYYTDDHYESFRLVVDD